MTIIRPKPSAEKKSDKLVLPLYEEGNLPTAPQGDTDSLNDLLPPPIYSRHSHARRLSCATSLCLLLLALTVVGLGALGGMYLHRQYLRSQVFRGWVGVPLSSQQSGQLQMRTNHVGVAGSEDDDEYGDWADASDDASDVLKDMMHMMRNAARGVEGDSDEEGDDQDGGTDGRFVKDDFFQEEMEVDLATNHESITVPDFRDGRSARFVHDFNTNHTGIIDTAAQRCFVMPLNRATVLPPQSLYDLVHKMWSGYYGVDTRVLREQWRVVTPEVAREELVEGVGEYIARECAGRKVYRLEKYVSGVVKRSADAKPDAKFASFSGKRIVELDIVNFAEIEQYEAKEQQP